MDRENSAFTAGVRPGGLTTTDGVLVLLCLLLAEAGEPVRFDQLRDALMKQELVNYFEFTDVMERMCTNCYAVCMVTPEGTCYTVTDLGRKTAEQCRYNLPVAVIDRAQGELSAMLIRARREKENEIVIRQCGGGWCISIVMNDPGGEILRVALTLPTEADCEAVHARFLDDPTEFYRRVLAAACGET